MGRVVIRREPAVCRGCDDGNIDTHHDSTADRKPEGVLQVEQESFAL